jgi:hypothetical protein
VGANRRCDNRLGLNRRVFVLCFEDTARTRRAALSLRVELSNFRSCPRQLVVVAPVLATDVRYDYLLSFALTRLSSTWPSRPTSTAIAGRPGCMPSLTCGSTFAGAQVKPSIRWQPAVRTSSATSGGSKTSAASSPPQCPGGCRSWSALIVSVSSTRCCPARRPTTSAVRSFHLSH